VAAPVEPGERAGGGEAERVGEDLIEGWWRVFVDAREIPSASLRAGSSLRLKNGYGEIETTSFMKIENNQHPGGTNDCYRNNRN
jgi:hypothetical protein